MDSFDLTYIIESKMKLPQFTKAWVLSGKHLCSYFFTGFFKRGYVTDGISQSLNLQSVIFVHNYLCFISPYQHHGVSLHIAVQIAV